MIRRKQDYNKAAMSLCNLNLLLDKYYETYYELQATSDQEEKLRRAKEIMVAAFRGPATLEIIPLCAPITMVEEFSLFALNEEKRSVAFILQGNKISFTTPQLLADALREEEAYSIKPISAFLQ